MAYLDLLHNRASVCMLILDRILDGYDVIATPGVDQVEQCSQG